MSIGIAYLVIATFAEGDPVTAFHNAVDLIEVERRLHIFIEPEWGAWIQPREWLIDVSNVVYFWGHAPTLAVCFLALYLARGRSPGIARAYSFFRTGFVTAELTGMLIYVLFPVTPPRLLPPGYGFVDTLALRSGVNYVEGDALVNTYAAFPSLHFAWMVIVPVALTRWHRWVAPSIVILPFVSLSSIVVTGNHYVLDAAGGMGVAALGLLVAFALPDDRIERFTSLAVRRLATVLRLRAPRGAL